MQYRTFGRTGWQVSEIGYGMWGMGGWSGSDDEQSRASINLAIERGVNFFDTAWAYGHGHSERLLGEALRNHQDKRIYAASKIPPMNMKWPSRPQYSLMEVFPPDHIKEYTEKSLVNLGLKTIDLMQFHVWEDSWAEDERWQRAVEDLKREGKVRVFGVSINRWEPTNVLQTLRSGLIDAVQVIYNIFDQAPEDALFPICAELNIGVIARVPFDEGSLTGTLTKESRWPENDWRSHYFSEPNLSQSVDRVEALRSIIPAGMTLPELALRFILANPTVSTIIPGMRQPRNVEANVAASDGRGLDAESLEKLRAHRWDRQPAPWSD